MNINRWIIFVFLLLCCDLLGARLKIGLILPRSENDIFFHPFYLFANAAANDLNVELIPYWGNNDHIEMVRLAEKAIKEDKVSAIIFENFKTAGKKIVALSDESGVYTMLVNSSFANKDDMGEPREKYSHWIGTIVPNEEKAGYELARILINKSGGFEKKRMIGFQGIVTEEASKGRVKGLLKAVEEENVDFLQVLPGKWDEGLVEKKFVFLKKGRYPHVNIVWNASDGMAMGVIQACDSLGLTPFNDVVTGGIDWTEEAITQVEKGNLAATMGGHFMYGAWSLILIHDYLKGVDFKGEGLVMEQPMYSITSENVSRFKSQFNDAKWNSMDFRIFSKYYNPRLTNYDFSLEKIFSIMNEVD